jgi:uncharacterized membrane protein
MPDPIRNIVQENFDRVAELELDLDRRINPIERKLHTVTKLIGTLPILVLHALLVGAWCLINSPFITADPLDPPPFFGLVTALAIETIALTIIILMTQNYIHRVAELKNHVILQMILLNEQETTKVLEVLGRVERALGIEDRDEGLEAMAQNTSTDDVISTVREAIDSGYADADDA